MQSLESEDSNKQMPSDIGPGVRDGVSVNFYFCKMPDSKCFRLCCHIFSMVTTQSFCRSVEAIEPIAE